MYTNVLVPLDGSSFSARALPIAAEIARRTGAALHLAIVHDPSSYIPFVAGEVAVPVYDAELARERRAEDQLVVDTHAATLKARGLSASGQLLEGTTVEALLEYGEEIGADLTVMTTHGRSGFARVRLGSVATAYLVRATTPVLLVRGGENLPAIPVGTLLCPLDGSPFAESILPHAAKFAESFGLTMALVAVTVPHAMPMAPLGTEMLIDPGALDAESVGQLEYLTRMLERCPVGSTAQTVTDLSASRAILEEAGRLNAGAIAMASHGRGGVRRMVLGSVADEVLRHADVPVLIYRPESPAT